MSKRLGNARKSKVKEISLPSVGSILLAAAVVSVLLADGIEVYAVPKSNRRSPQSKILSFSPKDECWSFQVGSAQVWELYHENQVQTREH
jgi:hypothetical protein